MRASFIIDEEGPIPISIYVCTVSKRRKEGGYGKTQEDRTEERNGPKAKASAGKTETEGERSAWNLAFGSIVGLVILRTIDGH